LQWYTKFTDVDEVIPVSAKYGHGVEDVKNWILSKLPNGPAYYPKACLKSKILFPLFKCPLLHYHGLISLIYRDKRRKPIRQRKDYLFFYYAPEYGKSNCI
jgi:translation elongation factor EF-4